MVEELIFLGRITFVQVAIMGFVSALLFNVTPITVSLYEKISGLENYLPILWRYRSFFEEHGYMANYPTVFSISLANIVLQILFLTGIAIWLSKKVNFRRAEPLPGKGNYIWLLCIALTTTVTIYLFTGPVDLRSSLLPWPPSASGYVTNCIVIPGANLVLAVLILARYPPSLVQARQRSPIRQGNLD
jgi:hypothetical protein